MECFKKAIPKSHFYMSDMLGRLLFLEGCPWKSFCHSKGTGALLEAKMCSWLYSTDTRRNKYTSALVSECLKV